ncbi:E3 ubiquitin-protein ligase TRIM39-like [Sphaerodactylus townsendi]|uniref:E3 ubiquitin-protein ligase TRIM39-like n=1 Tax=Sphaerodactylus townsendi TaxID=933632 RepID=UPI002025B75E|nr:E3 ubiquitin-protein ligase TRIM39-like [Sphaerodactylus townsendi]XP_048345448.1 E3 ubiquitin-protein ligase TRIM39-like [Sphaerodactylus townsendi]
MAAHSPKKRLRYEATCPVCLGYFTDPVTLDCGHNFCQSCITRSWEEPGKEAICPQCRIDVGKDFKPNRSLVSVVEISKQLGLPAARGAGLSKLECPKHQEPLKLFCKEDEISICVVCGLSKEHRNHGVVPIEEAAQEYKEELQSSLDDLKKKRENILECKKDTEKEGEDMLKHIEAEKKKVVVEFRDLCQFLEQQKKFLLDQMKMLQEEVQRERDEHVADLLVELSSLDSLIRETEEKIQQSASELLQTLYLTTNYKMLMESQVHRRGAGGLIKIVSLGFMEVLKVSVL